MPDKILGSKIVGEEYLVLHEFVKKAKEKLPKETWDYLIGAAETETTFKRNRLALDSLAFRPRVLRDVENVNLSSKLFGHELRIPVILAPIGSMQDFVEGAGVAPTKAASKFGIMHMISSTCMPGFEEVARSVNYPKLFQLYVRGDQNWVDDNIKQAIDLNYVGICLTVDLDAYGRRERDLAKRYRTTSRQSASGFEHQMRFSWKDVDRIKKFCDLPIIIKGIATREDAILAVEHGVEVIYVSNHGGRQLDFGLGGLKVLPEIVDAVGKKANIIFDGGVMRGTDVVKALSLGADIVGIGRLQGLAAAAAGSAGIYRMLELLELEILTCLRLLGVNEISELNSTFLTKDESLNTLDVFSAFPLINEGY
ncbi:alpha-hydroxy-acid oxidizing protein [Alphaproteobacteria bacterium]|nr:alpha-hydroxy-acid oxidizing protein [Alphaproteobacteria bacterium]